MYEKRMFERIKYATGKLKPFRSPQVAIPIGDTTQVITEPDEIAQQFRDHNLKHFSQAQGCILSTPEFQKVINKDQFNDMSLDPSSTEWRIREAINRISVENDNLEITPEEWRDKFKHWKESTSTSPSGVHLGHYKALLETMYVPNDTQLVMDLEIFEKQQDRFNIHLRLINSVLTHGRSITRWR